MRSTLLALSALVVLALSPAARADDAHPCKADAERLCPNLKPGHGALLRCLQDHQGEVSAACQARREEFKEHRQEAREERRERGAERRHDLKALGEACKADRERLCGGVKQGHGAVAGCMKAHESELSKACQDARQELKAKHGKGQRG